MGHRLATTTGCGFRAGLRFAFLSQRERVSRFTTSTIGGSTMRTITFSDSAESTLTGPQAVISDIRSSVATALMRQGIPGAVSVPISQDGVTGELELRASVSSKTGKVLYNISGEIILGGLTLRVQGNGFTPKNSRLQISGQDLADYQKAKAEVSAAWVVKKASKEPSDADLEAGESAE